MRRWNAIVVSEILTTCVEKNNLAFTQSYPRAFLSTLQILIINRLPRLSVREIEKDRLCCEKFQPELVDPFSATDKVSRSLNVRARVRISNEAIKRKVGREI